MANFTNFSIISSDFSPKYAFDENALKSQSVSILRGNNNSFIYALYGITKHTDFDNKRSKTELPLIYNTPRNYLRRLYPVS